jgi:hypothetical protein
MTLELGVERFVKAVEGENRQLGKSERANILWR